MAISPAPVSQHRGFSGCDQFSTGPPQQQPVGSGPVVPPLSRFSMKSGDGSPVSALTSRSLVECFDWTSARAPMTTKFLAICALAAFLGLDRLEIVGVQMLALTSSFSLRT